ncbi:uncharacterized protein Dwil_GK15128 [Drosophila willistoni]|uniref:N-acetyltransferase domain-containing protein n=1 Tax=Drosophila willistoni TaxID=7260 RepID=B4MVS1_DROWI|nr:uncharacterized protein LOC6641837 [Drosophila willistoni]EDW75791.2 uncharacterized protein Dwil_GK15128 [Drosophila willistoni]
MSELESVSLLEIPQDDWPKLRDLWATKPIISPGYQCLKIFIDWKEREPELQLQILTLNENWRNDGTFVLCLKLNEQIQHLYFNTLNDKLDGLTEALEIVPVTARKYFLFGYCSRLLPCARSYHNRFPDKKVHTNETVWYHASKELVSSFTIEIPPGVTLKTLQLKDAETINEIWPHREPGSIDFVNRLIKYNVNVGAYDDSGKLVAWCLRLPIGSLGLLQVLESHKRLGLGNLMVRYLSKQISALGDEVLAPVVHVNTPSRKMFEKLGFQPIDRLYWSFETA